MKDRDLTIGLCLRLRWQFGMRLVRGSRLLPPPDPTHVDAPLDYRQFDGRCFTFGPLELLLLREHRSPLSVRMMDEVLSRHGGDQGLR